MKMKSSSLMDEKGFIGELEETYKSMWKDWCKKHNFFCSSFFIVYGFYEK